MKSTHYNTRPFRAVNQCFQKINKAKKRSAEGELPNDAKRKKYGRRQIFRTKPTLITVLQTKYLVYKYVKYEPKQAMRLTLCLGCGEYLCQPTAYVEHCFGDHMCEFDRPNFKNLEKVVEIIESKIEKPKGQKPVSAALAPPPTVHFYFFWFPKMDMKSLILVNGTVRGNHGSDGISSDCRIVDVVEGRESVASCIVTVSHLCKLIENSRMRYFFQFLY